MVPTHKRWSPGARPGNTQWPIPVALEPDESITSWLAGCALAQGCTPTTLTSTLWRGWRCWTTDADRGIPRERLPALCSASGVVAEAIAAAALGPIACRVVGRDSKAQSAWAWIVARGRPGTGAPATPYCPACLRGDSRPHYRIGWRLAWHTGCAEHGVTLAERCPYCAKAQQLRHLPAQARDAAMCASCGRDLRDAVARPCLADALAFQQAGDEVARADRGPVFGEEADAAGWFATADFLSGLVRRASRSPTIGLTRLLLAAGILPALRLETAPGRRIERLGVGDRANVLAAVWNLMKLDRQALHSAATAAHISRQGWLGDRQTMPDVLRRAMPALPVRPVSRRRPARSRPAGPRPRHEVRQMVRRLERILDRTAGQ